MIVTIDFGATEEERDAKATVDARLMHSIDPEMPPCTYGFITNRENLIGFAKQLGIEDLNPWLDAWAINSEQGLPIMIVHGPEELLECL